MDYVRNKRVRFSHCDPAGIVFYPRYVELFNEVVEDWFADALGVGFHALHEEHRLGIPAVKLEVEYLAPSRYGDLLAFVLSVTRMGNSSIGLQIEARVGETVRVRGKLTVVLTSMDTFRPVALDDTWRARLAPYAND